MHPGEFVIVFQNFIFSDIFFSPFVFKVILVSIPSSLLFSTRAIWTTVSASRD